jgi:glucan phosphoethanolaminetransferase (alkaline phosphatase superfamily)
LLRFGLLALIVAVTNVGAMDRIVLLAHQARFGTIAFTFIIWLIAVAALLLMAVEPRWHVRLFWGALLGLSGAVAYGYQAASGSEMTVYDGLSLWSARHEAGDAAANYNSMLAMSLMLFAATIAIFMVPSRLIPKWRRGWGTICSVAPVLPVAMIASIIFFKQGGGSLGLPKQFSELSIASVVAAKNFLKPVVRRSEVAWQPNASRSVNKIVMMVDESVRSDYLDMDSPAGETPEFAKLAGKLVNFGPAASGGICSDTSNAILRFMASRDDLGGQINSNPTVWQFAKRAGYRTVYIDAQARNISSAGRLQNFMTLGEAAAIDKFYRIDVDADQADAALLDTVVDELKSGNKVFIYANKQGAHFPYDNGYPNNAAFYHPTNSEMGVETLESHIASYRNAILWNVDRFMGEMFRRADLTNAAMIYTSDHGQSLDPKGLTHCITENPNPRMGLVPLYAYAGMQGLRARLEQGAAKSRGRASHFQIAPSVLSWMGYDDRDLAVHYDESLMAGTARSPNFSTGDIFGMFSNRPIWNAIDLNRNYREEIPAKISALKAP